MSIFSSLLSYNCPHGMGIRCNSKFLTDYSPWTKSIPVLVCHTHPQSDAYGLKVLHFTRKNDSLTLTLANESAKPSPLEVHIPSLMQLPCLDLTPCINISNKYKALTLKCHHCNQSLSRCHCPCQQPLPKGGTCSNTRGLLWTLFTASSITPQFKCPGTDSYGNLTHWCPLH